MRVVALTCLTMTAGQAVNLASMTLSYSGLTVLHGVSLLYLAATIGTALLLRRTRNATLFGVLFTLIFLSAIGLSAVSAPGGDTTSAGINTSLTPAFVAIMALIGLLGSRVAAIVCAVLSTALIWSLYGLSVGSYHVLALGGAPYHRAFQAQLALVMTVLVTVPIGEVVYRTLESLESQRDRAERAEAARREYVATVSHEVRTPLSGVIGLSELLLNTHLDDKQREMATLLHSSAANMLDIVNDVRDTAKVEVASKPLDIPSIANEVRALFEADAADRGLWIGTKLTGEFAPGLMGDPRYLGQVLSNLASNAVKFTTTGGVRIGAAAGEPGQGMQRVTFFVQDTGPGIAPEDQGRVFERFAQTESARHATKRGSGLGLSICQRLVRAMGGEIAVRSAVGRGTVFHFTLALPSDALKAPEAAKAA